MKDYIEFASALTALIPLGLFLVFFTLDIVTLCIPKSAKQKIALRYAVKKQLPINSIHTTSICRKILFGVAFLLTYGFFLFWPFYQIFLTQSLLVQVVFSFSLLISTLCFCLYIGAHFSLALTTESNLYISSLLPFRIQCLPVASISSASFKGRGAIRFFKPDSTSRFWTTTFDVDTLLKELAVRQSQDSNR